MCSHFIGYLSAALGETSHPYSVNSKGIKENKTPVVAMGMESILLSLAIMPVLKIGSVFPDFPFDEDELKIRTGYYSNSGKYLGGIPKHSTEFKRFECTEFNYENSHDAPLGIETTVCLGWTEEVIGSSERAVVMCSCDALTTAGYCGEWTCSQLAVSFDPYTSISASETSSLNETQAERTECSCEIEDEVGKFCSTWTCAETMPGGGEQLKDYQCVRESSGFDYCEAWTGVSEDSEEVVLSACECVDEWNSVAVCYDWECESRIMGRCSRGGPGWCNIGVSIGVGGVFGSLGALLATCGLLRFVYRAKESYFESSGYDIFFGFGWMAAWSVGVLIWGGQDGAMFVGILWGGIVVVGLLCGWHFKTRS